MDALAWGILTLITLLVEVLTGTMFLYILAGSAGLTALFSYLFETSMTQQMLFYSGSSFAIYFFGSQWLKRRNIPLAKVNNPGAELIGNEYTLTSDIVNGRGKLNIGDAPWSLVGEDMPSGTVVVVASTNKGVLTVLKSTIES